MDLHNNSISGRKSGNSRLMNTNCKPWNKCPIRVFSGTAVPGWEECSFLMFLPFSHSNNIKFTCCLGWVSSWNCPPVCVLYWISSNYLQLSPTTLSPPPPTPIILLNSNYQDFKRNWSTMQKKEQHFSTNPCSLLKFLTTCFRHVFAYY